MKANLRRGDDGMAPAHSPAIQYQQIYRYLQRSALATPLYGMSITEVYCRDCSSGHGMIDCIIAYELEWFDGGAMVSYATRRIRIGCPAFLSD